MVAKASATIDLFTHEYNKKQNIAKSGVIHLGLSDHSSRTGLIIKKLGIKPIQKCTRTKHCARVKDPKQSCKLINEFLGKDNRANNISQLKIDETIISHDMKIAESFNAYFVSIGAKLAAEIESNSLDSSSSQYVISRLDIQFKFHELTYMKYLFSFIKIDRY
jgi:hypothetical protein